jgi:hypothetical protein
VARLPFLLAALTCTSCGGQHVPVFPVQGQVLYQGKPTPRAVVFFHPHGASGTDAVHPQGVVGEDGTFKVSTFTPGDGAPAGAYDVTIIWTKPGAGGDDAVNLLPVRYMHPATSGLTAQVQTGSTQLPPFKLAR